MKRFLLTSLLVATIGGAALAQTSTTPAVAPNATNPAAPVAGANSFTEAQARDRIEKAGYSAISGLTKDTNGIWRGKASKAGATTDVSLDYQGNVSAK